MDNELLEYIKNGLAQGTPRASIEANLLQSGWQKIQIDQTFNVIEGHRAPGPVLPWERASYPGSNESGESVAIQADPIKEIPSDNLIGRPNKIKSAVFLQWFYFIIILLLVFSFLISLSRFPNSPVAAAVVIFFPLFIVNLLLFFSLFKYSKTMLKISYYYLIFNLIFSIIIFISLYLLPYSPVFSIVIITMQLFYSSNVYIGLVFSSTLSTIFTNLMYVVFSESIPRVLLSSQFILYYGVLILSVVIFRKALKSFENTSKENKNIQ